MLTAQEALERLKIGNQRFVEGQTKHQRLLTHHERAQMAETQEPFAIVLGCSDSRVPAEMVFDQGFCNRFRHGRSINSLANQTKVVALSPVT